MLKAAQFNFALFVLVYRLPLLAQAPKGPISHNFAQSAVIGLPKDQARPHTGSAVPKDDIMIYHLPFTGYSSPFAAYDFLLFLYDLLFFKVTQ